MSAGFQALCFVITGAGFRPGPGNRGIFTMMKNRFPQYLSSPLQIIIFETDDLSIFFIAFGLWMFCANWMTFALMFAVPYTYMKLKVKYPNGFLMHFIYLAGFKDLGGYPISFETEFAE